MVEFKITESPLLFASSKSNEDQTGPDTQTSILDPSSKPLCYINFTRALLLTKGLMGSDNKFFQGEGESCLFLRTTFVLELIVKD